MTTSSVPSGWLRELAAKATPGPWGLNVNRRSEEAWVTYSEPPVVIARTDGRRWLGYESDARLIALAPDLAALCADMADALEKLASLSYEFDRDVAIDARHDFYVPGDSAHGVTISLGVMPLADQARVLLARFAALNTSQDTQ